MEMGMKLSGKWKWKLSLFMGMGWDRNGKEIMEVGGNGNQSTVTAHL